MTFDTVELRDGYIVEQRKSGRTLASIGHDVGLSHEMVRLICKRHGIKPFVDFISSLRWTRTALGEAVRLWGIHTRRGWKLRHGQHYRYSIGCRCDLCSENEAALLRAWRKSNPDKYIAAYERQNAKAAMRRNVERQQTKPTSGLQPILSA